VQIIFQSPTPHISLDSVSIEKYTQYPCLLFKIKLSTMKLSMSILSLAMLAMPGVTGDGLVSAMEASGLTALEEKWRVGPFSVTGQTLSLKYGSIGNEDAANRVIEFYARPTSSGGPTTDNEKIELNCYGESGEIQDSSPAGFGIETTINDGETLLAITFKRADGDSIETFDGYDDTDSNAPTVEFCVKVTVGGKIFRQLAVKYTFTLDGAIGMNDAVVVNDDRTSEAILQTVEYGIGLGIR
jgi:hypothetical protein